MKLSKSFILLSYFFEAKSNKQKWEKQKIGEQKVMCAKKQTFEQCEKYQTFKKFDTLLFPKTLSYKVFKSLLFPIFFD